MRHVFRLLIGADSVSAEQVIELPESEHRHAQVLRLEQGQEIEIVTESGEIWKALVAERTQEYTKVKALSIKDGAAEQNIHLIAGILSGNRFDELVDNCVQAGVTTITPYSESLRERERIDARRARLERVIQSATKQAKRGKIPLIQPAISRGELLTLPHGIFLDVQARTPLTEVVRAEETTLLIGSAAGLTDDLVAELKAGGWCDAHLGSSIMRSELAAAVATAMVAL